jgi:hypothetical protein
MMFVMAVVSVNAHATISVEKTAPKYIILSSFKSSMKIWGTYDQIFEAGYKLNQYGKRTLKNNVKSPIANIIFKKGKIFFIRPNQKNNSISIEVLGLPYKKIKKRSYKLYTKGFNEKLYSLFEEHIQSVIKNGIYRKERISKLTVNDVIFKDAVCSRKKRIYQCQFPIELREGEEYKMPKESDDLIELNEIKDLKEFTNLKSLPISAHSLNMKFIKKLIKSPLFQRYQHQLKHHQRKQRRVPSSNTIH